MQADAGTGLAERARDDEYDFIVIGSGFGGSVSALRLAEKGYRVAVLEMGKRYRPEDFARTSWGVRRYLWFPRLRCFGVQKISLLRDVVVLHGVGVGGGSLVYANVMFQPPAERLRDPAWSALGDWEKLLAPHYATVRRMLGVVESPHLGRGDELLREVADEMGRGDTYQRTQIGVFFGDGPGAEAPDPYLGGAGPPRKGCVLCGGCMIGCRFHAKNTLDHNYLYLAEKLGVEIHAETRVVDVRPAPGRGYCVDVERSTALFRKRRATLRARNVVVAAGVVGTLDLLMRARARGSLPDLPARLGTRVRTNGETLVGVRARRRGTDFTPGTAIQAGFHPDDETFIQVCRYSSGSDLVGLGNTVFVGGESRWPRWVRYLGAIARHPLAFLRLLNPFGWARRTMILLVMQANDSSLDLALRRRWYWPFQRLLDSGGGARRPRASPAIAEQVVGRLARRMPGIPTMLTTSAVLDTSATAHILGGCPMGHGPEDGVVDAACRVFGHPGLYVVDGSILPVNLGINPSLTIAALAEHAMSQIPAKQDGEVGKDRQNRVPR